MFVRVTAWSAFTIKVKIKLEENMSTKCIEMDLQTVQSLRLSKMATIPHTDKMNIHYSLAKDVKEKEWLRRGGPAVGFFPEDFVLNGM